MGRPEAILERRKRKQAKIANAPALREAELNAYNPTNPDWNTKEIGLSALAIALTPREFNKALTNLAVKLWTSPRFSNTQADNFMMSLYEAPEGAYTLVERGVIGDRVAHRINTNSDLQISTLVNTFLLRSTTSAQTRADLAVSILNSAHMAVGTLKVLEVDFKTKSYPDIFLKNHLGNIIRQRQRLVHELASQRIISPSEAEAFLEVETPEDLERCSSSADYLLVKPFQRRVELASRLTTAFKRAQDLLYLGFSMGMRDLNKVYWGNPY